MDMETKNFKYKAEECLKLLDNQKKIKATPFFETRQMAMIEVKLHFSEASFSWHTILKPAFIVFLIGINLTIIYTYLNKNSAYTETRNTALIKLSDNYMRSSDYYLSLNK